MDEPVPCPECDEPILPGWYSLTAVVGPEDNRFEVHCHSNGRRGEDERVVLIWAPDHWGPAPEPGTNLIIEKESFVVTELQPRIDNMFAVWAEPKT